MLKLTKTEFLALLADFHIKWQEADRNEDPDRSAAVDDQVLTLYDEISEAHYDKLAEARTEAYRAGFVDAALKYADKEALFRRLT